MVLHKQAPDKCLLPLWPVAITKTEEDLLKCPGAAQVLLCGVCPEFDGFYHAMLLREKMQRPYTNRNQLNIKRQYKPKYL